jgi:hypothetical protein
MIDINRGVPGKRCGAFRPGHDMHYIQARLCSEAGPGVPSRVDRVDDDGTIHLADGTTVWNHDPEGVRKLLSARGNDVFVASHGVLRVPDETGAYMVCVSTAPDPCRPETAEVIPGESIRDEVLRRGGTIRKITRITDSD